MGSGAAGRPRQAPGPSRPISPGWMVRRIRGRLLLGGWKPRAGSGAARAGSGPAPWASRARRSLPEATAPKPGFESPGQPPRQARGPLTFAGTGPTTGGERAPRRPFAGCCRRPRARACQDRPAPPGGPRRSASPAARGPHLASGAGPAVLRTSPGDADLTVPAWGRGGGIACWLDGADCPGERQARCFCFCSICRSISSSSCCTQLLLLLVLLLVLVLLLLLLLLQQPPLLYAGQAQLPTHSPTPPSAAETWERGPGGGRARPAGPPLRGSGPRRGALRVSLVLSVSLCARAWKCCVRGWRGEVSMGRRRRRRCRSSCPSCPSRPSWSRSGVCVCDCFVNVCVRALVCVERRLEGDLEKQGGEKGTAKGRDGVWRKGREVCVWERTGEPRWVRMRGRWG